MKKVSVLLLFLLFVLGFSSFGQDEGGVSIGKGDLPSHNKAILELFSSDKGLLITRMSTDQRLAMFGGSDNSSRGLMVFDSSLNAFYFWDGNTWKTVGSQSVKMVTGTPSYSATSGELAFDTQNSSMYIYSGTNWVKTSGSVTASSVDLDPLLIGSWLYLGYQDGKLVKVDLSSLKVIEPNDIKKMRNTSVGLYSDDVQSAIWELADKIKTLSTPQGGGMITVAHDITLTGSGTSALPLGVAVGGIGTSQLGANVVTEEKIAANAVSIDKIRGGGIDKVLGTNGSGAAVWLDKSSFGGGATGIGVIHDGTLSGSGTTNDPLKISVQNASPGAVLQWASNTTLGWVPGKVRPANLEGVVGDGELNQALVSNGYGGFKWRTIDFSGSSGAIADGSVTTTKVADGAITSLKIAPATIQSNNLSSMGATTGQVLQWNGSLWMPATVSSGGSNYVLPTASATTLGGVRIGSNLSIDASGVLSATGASVTLAGDNYLSISGSTITANKVNLGTNVSGMLNAANFPALTGEVTTAAGTLNTTIANNAVTSAKIQNGTIQAADLNQMGASNGQVLQWNDATSSWGPATVTSGGDADSDPSNEIELPVKTGNANKILAVNATETAVQWIDAPSGSGFPASITSPTTVNLGNNDLTLTSGAGGTGKVVTNNFQTTGAVYAKYRVYTGSAASFVLNADDYIVSLRISNGGNLPLPDPASCPGRVILFRNDSAKAGTAGTITYINFPPANNTTILAARGQMLVSDGTDWLVVSGI